MANELYLDLKTLEEDLRAIIKSTIKSKDVIKKFGEIHVLPIDSDLNSEIVMPAVYIFATKNGPYIRTQEDIQVEPYSRFSITVETYTNGSKRRSQNIELAQFMTSILQTNQQLKHYYNRGLRLDQDNEATSFIDGANRRVIRFSGIVDNASKLIYNKER